MKESDDRYLDSLFYGLFVNEFSLYKKGGKFTFEELMATIYSKGIKVDKQAIKNKLENYIQLGYIFKQKDSNIYRVER